MSYYLAYSEYYTTSGSLQELSKICGIHSISKGLPLSFVVINTARALRITELREIHS
jgi:hypothetical protein